MNDFKQWRVTVNGRLEVSDENGKFHPVEDEPQEDE